jgi:hypothetical protein
MASLFKELKPLMNATFEASQSINRTAPILAWTQSLMILLLAAIFATLFGLLVALNPDMEAERRQYVTPATRFLLGQAVTRGAAVGRVAGEPIRAAKDGVALIFGAMGAARESATASSKGTPRGGEGGKKTS